MPGCRCSVLILIPRFRVSCAGMLRPGKPMLPRTNIAVFPRSNPRRSEEHTSELQSLMRISYAVFCLKKKKPSNHILTHYPIHIISYLKNKTINVHSYMHITHIHHYFY